MFTDGALIDQSTALHYTVRGMIQFVALPAHPVERERSESEIQVLQEDLFSISSCLVFRKEEKPTSPVVVVLGSISGNVRPANSPVMAFLAAR